MQRQLKSSFIKTSFESKNIKNMFHCLQQLVDIYKFVYIYKQNSVICTKLLYIYINHR